MGIQQGKAQKQMEKETTNWNYKNRKKSSALSFFIPTTFFPVFQVFICNGLLFSQWRQQWWSRTNSGHYQTVIYFKEDMLCFLSFFSFPSVCYIFLCMSKVLKVKCRKSTQQKLLHSRENTLLKSPVCSTPSQRHCIKICVKTIFSGELKMHGSWKHNLVDRKYGEWCCLNRGMWHLTNQSRLGILGEGTLKKQEITLLLRWTA